MIGKVENLMDVIQEGQGILDSLISLDLFVF